jgi:integrase/recombinase XerD
MVLNSVSSPHSRRAYARALDDFFDWYGSETRLPFSKALVQEYRAELERSGLSPSTVNVRLAALRKLAAEAADGGLLPVDVAAAVGKVKGVRQQGVRTGNWLTREQARDLLLQPNPSTLRGKRDRAILGLLIGCGLRRSEVIELEVDSIKQREGRAVIVDINGKGNRVRSVPVPSWTSALVEDWTRAASISTGRIFRPISGAGVVDSRGLTEKVVWWIVKRYAEPLGLGKLAPHDLRRTCAKLCRASGGDLEQIQLLLGHASVQTTERYLGTRQNLADAVNDRLGIEM